MAKKGKNRGRAPQKKKGYGSKKGWHGESARHSLASRGVPTTEGPRGDININVVGMDSSTSPQEGRSLLTGLGGQRQFGQQQISGEQPVVSFAEDMEIEQQVHGMENEAVVLKGKIKAEELDLATTIGERKSMDRIHSAEREQKLTQLFGKKPGWLTSVKDLPPAKQKDYQEFKSKQDRKAADKNAIIASKKAEIKMLKARLSNKKSDLSRRKNYLEDITKMREKEQRKRVETLEQTRTLNRVIQEGQR